MTCHPTIRRAHRHLRRHVTGYVVGVLATGCIGGPVAAITLAPSPIARQVDAPQPVSEPGSVWVLGVGVAAVAAVKITQKMKEGLNGHE